MYNMYKTLVNLFLTVCGSSTLAFGLINTAFAVSFNFSGRFGNDASCSSTLVSAEFLQCPVEGLEGRPFTGATTSRESSNLVLSNVSFNGGSRTFFISENIINDQGITRLSLTTNVVPDFFEQFSLSFSQPEAGSSELFGAFLGGSYSRDEGRNPRFSQRISIAEATITRAISIPEANTVPGIFASAMIFGWLLRRKL